ncbi:hypothetical protein AAG906_020015 [Vitis piasezkii]
MPPSKQKPSRKPSKDRFYHSKRGTYDNYRMNDTKQSRHVQRRVNKDTQKKINNLSVSDDLKNMLCKVMLNSTDSESRIDSDNEDDINQLDSSDEKPRRFNPYNLNDILNSLTRSPKEVSIKELHEEVKQYKNEIKELKQFISLGLSDLQDQINRIVNQENHMDIPESSHTNDNETDTFLNTVRAAENCLQEGLVPIPLCEETSQSLFGANGKRLAIKYKLTNVHIRNHDICIKQTFILVKDLKEKALLGIPFLSSIYPLWVDNQGIRTKLFDKEILFEFANPSRPPNTQPFQGLRPSSNSSFSQENSYVEYDDSTSYLPNNEFLKLCASYQKRKHVSSQSKEACLQSFQPKARFRRTLPVEPLLAVDRRYDWKLPKVSNQEIYKKETFKFFTDYTIKTSEMTVSLEQDDQVIRLLDNRSVEKHKKDGYNFIHFGMIQVAAKPLTRLGLNTSIVMFRIRDADILDSVVLHIKTHGFKIKPGNSPVSIITRFAYKSMNTSVGSGALCTSPKVSFMNPLELQALLSQLEPLGKKKDPAQEILRTLS